MARLRETDSSIYESLAEQLDFISAIFQQLYIWAYFSSENETINSTPVFTDMYASPDGKHLFLFKTEDVSKGFTRFSHFKTPLSHK